jgi:hypothetical protein
MERHVLPDHIGIVAAVVFNLGYLPGGDKSITTKAESTVQAVEQSLQILRDGSPLIIVCYRHPEGNREFDVLQQFCSDLPQTRYTVMRTEFVNQRGNPPVVFVVVPALTGDPR